MAPFACKCATQVSDFLDAHPGYLPDGWASRVLPPLQPLPDVPSDGEGAVEDDSMEADDGDDDETEEEEEEESESESGLEVEEDASSSDEAEEEEEEEEEASASESFSSEEDETDAEPSQRGADLDWG